MNAAKNEFKIFAVQKKRKHITRIIQLTFSSNHDRNKINKCKIKAAKSLKSTRKLKLLKNKITFSFIKYKMANLLRK
jgi:hypothetical protein